MPILLLACLVILGRQLCVSSLAQSNDDNAIRSLVQKLFESYQQKDLERLISNWSEKSPFLAQNKRSLQDEFAANDKIVVKGFGIRQMNIDGDRVTMRVAADMAITRTTNMVKPVEKIVKKNRTIELVNEGGIWKVWRLTPSEEELAAAIMASKTEEEQNALIEREPELMTSDLAFALGRQILSASPDELDYRHALAISRLASKVAEQTGDQSAIAYSLGNAGYIHGWIGTPEKSPKLALEYFQKSLKISEEVGDKGLTTHSMITSAIILETLGELTTAAEYYQKSINLAEELGNHDWIIQSSINLGAIHRENGNYAKALELLLKGLKISERQPRSGADWDMLSHILTRIGDVFLSQGNYQQALAYEQRAVEAADRAIMLREHLSKLTKATVLVNIGEAYLQQGEYSLAMDYFQRGLKLTDETENIPLNAKENYISQIKMKMGDVLAAENKTMQAIVNYQEALQLGEKSGDKSIFTGPLQSLGRMYLLQGDYRQALNLTERAIIYAEQNSQYIHIFSALQIAAKAYQKLGQPEDARKALTRAIDIVEQLRGQTVGGELDRQEAFEEVVTPYQAMIDLFANQERFTEAFSYAQRAKGRTLLELLQNGRIDINKSASQAEREQEQQLTREIASLNRQVTGEKLKPQPDEKRLAQFEDQLKKARLKFEAFRTTLYAAHPELKVQRGEIRPISFDDIASLIPDSKTALLDFIVTDENVHLFVLTKDASARTALNTYTIKIERKALAEKVERYRRRMENRDYDFQALSRELYVLLIKPAQKQLQSKTNLIISPDNVLWDLPFQTLLSPELRYLIEDSAISYAPSLSVLREMKLVREKKRAQAKASLLALGNPALGARSKELAKFVKMDAQLQSLPEAAAQVKELERLYGKTLSRVYTGTAAREELIKEQSAHYRILHLAAHGILNDVNPMYSHVLLSQTPGRSDEDGLLEAWEMMDLDLNADLVVLAACETARGRAGAGEGVIGMTWALFVAGCPRSVVSQWKVEASSTTALMVEFHKRFKTRYGGRQPAVSTAEAMRQAALKVMKNAEYVHPFYWGGFVVVGEGN
jgi:CHAT domain-containing protein/tetratricopeptide (TPR) repeat protein